MKATNKRTTEESHYTYMVMTNFKGNQRNAIKTTKRYHFVPRSDGQKIKQIKLYVGGDVGKRAPRTQAQLMRVWTERAFLERII